MAGTMASAPRSKIKACPVHGLDLPCAVCAELADERRKVWEEAAGQLAKAMIEKQPLSDLYESWMARAGTLELDVLAQRLRSKAEGKE